MTRSFSGYLFSVVALLLANLGPGSASAADADWPLHGRTHDEQRFSPLTGINTNNVASLGLDWYFETDLYRGHEATPLIVDGKMFLTGPWSRVFALDARSGKVLWRYNPAVPGKKGYDACCDVVNRGVAVADGKVFLGALDGRLIALEADTGKLIWEVQTTDPDRPYTITGAPRVINGRVFIGNGGAELGVRGYITAYDAGTGKQLWRFFSVPGDPAEPFESEAMARAAKTWHGGEWWKIGGGGTMWDSMAYDPALDLLYVGTGNGSPWNRWIRSPGGGDNLYLSSIVALEPATGKLVWYFQTTPGDTWDFTATQHLILADLRINDETRRVIMQAPKNGFFYVLDRQTGEFISGKPYLPVNWANGLDEAGRPIENKDRLYRDGPKQVTPTPLGGHNWHPMTFSPATGLVYIPTRQQVSIYAPDPNFSYDPRKKDAWGVRMGERDDTPEAEQDPPETEYFLTAWDPRVQHLAFRVPSASQLGGLLSTAGGLVFGGDGDGNFNAWRADDGQLLWGWFTERGILAPPVTYTLDGKQYIAVLTGWGGAGGLQRGSDNPRVRNRETGRLLVFSLGGTEVLPEQFDFAAEPELPPLTADEATLALGETLFRDYCSRCHSFSPGGALSDLINMPESSHRAFTRIVSDGLFESAGMIGFGEMLSNKEVDAIHQYIIKSAMTPPDTISGKE